MIFWFGVFVFIAFLMSFAEISAGKAGWVSYIIAIFSISIVWSIVFFSGFGFVPNHKYILEDGEIYEVVSIGSFFDELDGMKNAVIVKNRKKQILAFVVENLPPDVFRYEKGKFCPVSEKIPSR